MTRTVLKQAASVAVVMALVYGQSPALHAADLKAPTVAAFDRYVALTEQRLSAADQPFLWVDAKPSSQRQSMLRSLQTGGLVMEPVTTRDGTRTIDVPDGMIHHWIGVVFVPGTTLSAAVALLQDYDRHHEIYKPNVADSRVLSHDGDRFRVRLRFFMKKVITVVVNTDNDARFFRDGPDRASSRIHSTRIAEVENAGATTERELPVGHDGGYLWRLNSYWRFLERDGGVYIQCESITLTRDIPTGVGWLVRPFVTSLPRETLTFTLTTTRQALKEPAGASQSRPSTTPSR
jgi:hypothetical protein